MKLILGVTEFRIDEPTAVAIGKFDGIHKGHRKLLEELFEAKKEGLKTAVFTFDPSPAAYFASLAATGRSAEGAMSREREMGLSDLMGRRGKVLVPGTRVRDREDEVYRELMTKEEKRKMFESLGIDYLVEYPFRADTAAVTPEDYINRFLLDQMQAKLIVAGEDVSFGKNGAGNAALLCELAEKGGAKALIIPKICYQGQEISSTLVRDAVSQGQMEMAKELLGEPFTVSGIVCVGNKLGRKLGMPTANLYPKAEKLLPPNGVYASRIRIDTEIFRGITNIGCKPTINQETKKLGVETHIFDFDEDLYDREIEVELLSFLRPEQQFADLAALQEQMQKDAQRCRAFLEKEQA